ncbi:Gfo/Idh/MocA family protein [Rhizomicrobium electricum]|uniref:Gfo/Idh/MocA family oxidoreductase n=1 Tax=Rhizomicrobium electricum TaxID=480070 RepID=A0ABN1EU75_9PROT|nr:Gfo/Idh/MocA family oxidoreductase [Rhizomicrobium electricum]NIJ49700.1 putative dehydrogenase [Rhizomicrobium electricum]
MSRIALIGLGMAVTPHAKSLVDLGADVVAMSPSESRRQAFAARFPFPTTGDLNAIAADKSIEAVGLLTPPNTHLELIETFAAAGKHILLEKPLDITPARAEAVVAAGEKHGVTIAVVLQHRFKPAAEKLAALLASGRLGKIVSCSTRIPWWRPQSYYDEPGRGSFARDGGGVLISQAIHTLDLMLSLAEPVAGRLTDVCGFTATTAVHRMETEDYAASAVRFAGGALGVIEATTARYPGDVERIDFIGTEGTATLSGYGFSARFHDGSEDGFTPPPTAGGGGADPMAFPHDLHRAVWADFFDAIAHKRAPRITAREALKVHRLIEAMLEAGKSGATVNVRE